MRFGSEAVSRDRREFPEIGAAAVYAAVVETDQGFVSVTLIDEVEAERWRDEYALDADAVEDVDRG